MQKDFDPVDDDHSSNEEILTSYIKSLGDTTTSIVASLPSFIRQELDAASSKRRAQKVLVKANQRGFDVSQSQEGFIKATDPVLKDLTPETVQQNPFSSAPVGIVRINLVMELQQELLEAQRHNMKELTGVLLELVSMAPEVLLETLKKRTP